MIPLTSLSSAPIPVFQPSVKPAKQRVSNDYMFERAFFPRLTWAFTDAAFLIGDREGRQIVREFHADLKFWLDQARNQTQFCEVKAPLDDVVNGLIDDLIDRQAGTLRTTKIVMVGYGLCLLAADHADDMFTGRFEATLNAVNDHLRSEAGDEMAVVEPSAQKALKRAVKYLHSRHKFKWMAV
ncbi:hypothetical protein [Thalassospira marina]|uniref:Uncharacterized protein n=1 Tax=Thalassospira marina TaxID=2048283 RepID=A0A2N3KXZ6_9PROT|nr:hypothetical protein [Thalassospira marina]PKR55418.1 hypothetical protein COO20_04405 [Thalassospira marina]